MKRRIAIIAISLLMVATVLAGCSSTQGETGSGSKESNVQSDATLSDASVSEDQKQEGAIELTFYYPVQVGGPITQVVEGYCDEFTAANPSIVIKPVYTGNYDDTIAKIQTAIQGGTPPDVFVSLYNHRYMMSSTQIALCLDDLLAADGDDGQAYIQDFLPGFIGDSYVDGKLYSIPFQRSTMVLFYNKEAFNEVGLDPNSPPTTWDEMIDYAQRLTKKDASGNFERYGVGFSLASGTMQWPYTGFYMQNTTEGNLMSDDGKEVYFNTPESIEVLELWCDLQSKYQCMQDGIIQWADLPGQFLDGQVAMIYHTTGSITNINTNATFEYGTAFLPGNKRVATPTGGGNLYITNNIEPERQKAAWEFIKFITSTEKAAQWNIDTGYVASRESCFDTDLIKDYYAEVPQAAVAKEQLVYADAELSTYDCPKIWRILADNVQAAIIGETTPTEALNNAQAEADEVLSKY